MGWRDPGCVSRLGNKNVEWDCVAAPPMSPMNTQVSVQAVHGEDDKAVRCTRCPGGKVKADREGREEDQASGMVGDKGECQTTA